MIVVDRLDHLVFTVKSLSATIAFYSEILGMEVVTFGEGRKALQFGLQKINLHQVGNEFSPHAESPVSGSEDLCFVISSELEDTIAVLNQHNIEIIEGPVTRTGALGPITSIYIRDPDLNLIELCRYGN